MTGPLNSPVLSSLLQRLGALRSAYQPIVDLTTGRPTAYEALARFGPGVAVDVAFARARGAGVGLELEAAALRSALTAGHPPGGARLSVNVSPSALASHRVIAELPADLSWIIIEITENELVEHEDAIQRNLQTLRGRGAMIAVDDAGAGYASLKQVMMLRPDVIKLDRSLITGLHEDAAKRALIRAFVAFGRDLGAGVCAEGIEAAEELRALADLDVGTGQGYMIARPGAPWAAVDAGAVAACTNSLGAALAGRGSLSADTATQLEVVGRALAGCRTLQELSASIETAQQLLGVPEMSISRLVRHADGVGIVSCAGPRWSTEPVYRLQDYPATAQALNGDAALQVLVSDPDADAAERDLLRAHGYGAMLLMPLRHRGAPVGTMELFSREERPWTRRQIVLARALAHQLAVLLAHLHVEPALRTRAGTDDEAGASLAA
jgi:EAL domain-containing protein (putative c-di-GMP-specific phosphodiesterase class I)